MQIVIDIPEIAYKLFKSDTPIEIDWLDAENILNRIADGIVLPKGHGRLIDADVYRKEMLDSKEFDFFKILDMQPTIIPATKGE